MKISLGQLQLAIMRIIWERGEATVAEVHHALGRARPLAHTTVATMLVKLEKKGVITHRQDGRKYVYRPLVSESEVSRSMVGQLKDSLFGGNVASMVSHLLNEHDVNEKEIARLRKMINETESQVEDGDDAP